MAAGLDKRRGGGVQRAVAAANNHQIDSAVFAK